MEQTSYTVASFALGSYAGANLISDISSVLVKQILDMQETLEFYELHLNQPPAAEEPAETCPEEAQMNSIPDMMNWIFGTV